MKVWFDVSLDEVEALLEYSVKIILTAWSLLSHYCCIVKGKLPHLKVILFNQVCHDSVHSMLYWSKNGVIVEITHQKTANSCCSL